MHENPPIQVIYQEWIAQDTVENIRQDIEFIRHRVYCAYRQENILDRLARVKVQCCLHHGLGQIFFLVWEGGRVLSVKPQIFETQAWLDALPATIWAAQEQDFEVIMEGGMDQYLPIYPQGEH